MNYPLIHCTGDNPACSIIWLHGLGADGHDFLPLVQQLSLPCPVRFVLPHAPRMPVHVNQNALMPAWYNITHPNLALQPDLQGMQHSVQQIQTLIDHERSQGNHPIILAGFSQGGVIALLSALHSPEPVAGVIALSCYLPADELPTPPTPLSVLMLHGLHDPVIPIAHARASRDRLREQGHTVDWHALAMPHTVSPDAHALIQGWLQQHLAVL